MRSWRWLGLVFSVLWLVGFGVWLWISSVGERPEWYALQLQRCYSSSEIKREKLQPERYDSQLADVSREYQSCIVQAKTIFDGQMNKLVLTSGKSWPSMPVRSPQFGCWCFWGFQLADGSRCASVSGRNAPEPEKGP